MIGSYRSLPFCCGSLTVIAKLQKKIQSKIPADSGDQMAGHLDTAAQLCLPVLHRTTLHYTTPHHTALHCTERKYSMGFLRSMDYGCHFVLQCSTGVIMSGPVLGSIYVFSINNLSLDPGFICTSHPPSCLKPPLLCCLQVNNALALDKLLCMELFPFDKLSNRRTTCTVVALRLLFGR